MTIKLILPGTHRVSEPGSWQQCLWTAVSWSGLSWNHSAALMSCLEHAPHVGAQGYQQSLHSQRPGLWDPFRQFSHIFITLNARYSGIGMEWRGVGGGTSGEVVLSDTECGQLLACLLCQWDVSRWVTVRICPRNSLQASLVRLFCLVRVWSDVDSCLGKWGPGRSNPGNCSYSSMYHTLAVC